MAIRKPKQQELFRHGGKRKGAGRRNLSGLRAHVKRPNIDKTLPLHVTLKLNRGISSLKTKAMLQALKQSVIQARKQGLRINHYCILSNHVHFILECGSNRTLQRSMKSLCIGLALKIKNLSGTKGSVFIDRYDLHVLKTPTETRRALKYVLLNEQKHTQGHLRNVKSVLWSSFSSAHSFNQWMSLVGFPIGPSPTFKSELSDYLSPPSTWLLQQGWQRAGA